MLFRSMVLQNATFLGGLAAAATGSAAATTVLEASMALDLAGILLLGIAVLGLTLRPGSRSRLGLLAGFLCFAWLALTIGWRIVGRDAFADLVLLPAGAVPAFLPGVLWLLAAWILATVALALAAVLFAVALHRQTHGTRTSLAWPLAALLNAAATILLVGALLALLGGTVSFPVLATALFAKLVLVPAFSVPAYALLARTFLRLGEGETAAVRPAPSAPPGDPESRAP